MKVSGFTIIRNAVLYDYPVVESILSVLPLVDEFIVLVGDSEDDTLQLIESIDNPKIKIIHSTWDLTLREGGHLLANETNKAMQYISKESDWAIYIQADEVMHQEDYPAIIDAMHLWKDNKNVEGLLFDYVHFYGSYDFVGDSRRWYRKEVRIIRPHSGILSYKDAQGFRKNGFKLNVKHAFGRIFHYGWVKPPSKQQAKQRFFHKLWHDDAWMNENIADVEEFDYSGIDSVARFEGTHPEIMKDRIGRANWSVSIDPSKKKIKLKHQISELIEKITGYRIGEYKNYKLLKD